MKLFKKKRNHQTGKIIAINPDYDYLLEQPLHLSFIENHPSPVIILNTDGEVVAYNQQIIAFSKLHPDRIPKYLEQFSDPTFIHHFRRCAADKRPQQFKSFIHDHTQEKLHVEIMLIPIMFSDAFVGAFGVYRDLSELDAIQATVHDQEINLNESEKLANVGSCKYLISTDEYIWSDNAYRILGIHPAQYPNFTFEQFMAFVHPEDAPALQHSLIEAVDSQKEVAVQYRIIRPDGAHRSISGQLVFHMDKRGEPSRMFAILQDITDREFLKSDAQNKESHSHIIFNNLDVCIWSMDVAQNKITFCSKACEGIYQIPVSAFLANPLMWKEAIHPDDIDLVERNQRILERGEILNHEYRIIVGYDKEIKWVRDHIIPTVDENGQLVQLDGIVQDITKQKLSDNQLAHIANHDQLTKLLNRNALNQDMERWIGTQTSFGICMLDLDGFKRINDSLGHEIGDQLLAACAIRLEHVSRGMGYAYRVGGDEFALLFPTKEFEEELHERMEHIITRLQEAFQLQDYQLFISASIGVCFYPNDGDTVDELLKKADQAMYRAKNTGKNTYQIYAQAADIDAFKTYTLERDLRKALDRHELYLEYQPKVDAFTKRIVGMEALVRWRHDEWGIISPQEFITIAEQSDLILKIDEYVFKKAVEQLSSWIKAGIPLKPVAINMSAKHFYRSALAEKVSAMLKRYEVPAPLIIIEITETSLLGHESNVLKELNKLMELGITFSLDDYGTGYSSLNYLKQFRFHSLKIDRSLIADMLDEKNEMLVKSIIQVAHCLNMKVIAEGVEVKGQFDILKKMKCDVIQGFFFSKPVSAEEVEAQLKNTFLTPKSLKVKPGIERRKYFRVDLPEPIPATMTIHTVDEKPVVVGSSTIMLENIGLAGLCFRTPLKLPVNNKVIYLFHWVMLGESVSALGQLVWTSEGNEYHNYGVEFRMVESHRKKLYALLTAFMRRHAVDIPEDGI
ncbi:EAL domain-containing protein [Paenibacillus sp. HB172176]|uniref:EAL domain-containing protein n=1 Tax=Paenibacillus sp. HB172176 TaxID=2493690 RepID=UPI0014392811|nr:EAL domain-containing protein [Paenibacillus sp. HB172176]